MKVLTGQGTPPGTSPREPKPDHKTCLQGLPTGCFQNPQITPPGKTGQGTFARFAREGSKKVSSRESGRGLNLGIEPGAASRPNRLPMGSKWAAKPAPGPARPGPGKHFGGQKRTRPERDARDAHFTSFFAMIWKRHVRISLQKMR